MLPPPVASRIEQDRNRVAYQFEDTPKMSSYLVAFAVGEFEHVEAHDSDKVLARVYSRPGLVSESGRGEFALDTVCRSLPFYGDFFGIRYPLPKVDLLAIPDFASGAMENWGLVTFRERTLLVEKDNSSPSSKEAIALTISHELAHMWFGNLVTMEWWTDLWLKEGFASWIEYLCVDHCFPEMDVWTHFTSDQIASALRLDALENSHPIEVEVNNPEEIDEIFDSISYCKGSSLIHMLHAYMGDRAFRDGLCSYLKKHAYGNARTEDLWASLGSASGLPIASIMRPWTRVAGFPVVFVRPLEAQNGRLMVQVKQTQYRLPSRAPQPPGAEQLWSVPLVFSCYSTSGQHHVIHQHVLTESEAVIEIPVTWPTSDLSGCLVQLNPDAAGFYHVCYAEDQLHRLAMHIKKMNAPASTKFGFVNDGFALTKAGYLSISDWLVHLTEFLKDERSYAVWRCALIDGLGTYVRRLVHEDGSSLSVYLTFLRKLTRPMLDNLGFFKSEESLSHDDRLLRSLLVTTAGAEAGDADVIAEAKRRYQLYRSGGDKAAIPGDLRAAILTTVVRHDGDINILEHLMKTYRTIKSPEERSHILTALGAARELELNSNQSGDHSPTPLQRVIQFCLDPAGPVRDQDRIHGLLACASWSSASRLVTWNSVKVEWDRLSKLYHGQCLLAYLVKGILSGFATEEHVSDAKIFFEQHPVSFPRALKQAEETMDTNLLLLPRDAPLLLRTLTKLASN
ncbi:unnamed protein product [Dicrocoelium dendriticum]|nr:unnamed protein product [Dicrocoelium dendriticum]